ncbi:MAG: Protein TolB [Chloroflexi bacterium OLB15]|nr:MAG: Protein TolB [Chloroflexi bacterium OLB15]
MTRLWIQRWLTGFCAGLLCLIGLSISAQGFPDDSESPPKIQVTSSITYVAPGANGRDSDIYVMTLLDEAGFIDHDNNPDTPRVIEEGGYEITNLTNTPEINEIDPLFSPSGNFVAFRRETSPGIQTLIISDIYGENSVQITPKGVNVLNTAFSLDGTQVAFSAQWGSEQFRLYRSDIDGENQYLLTPGEGFNVGFPLWHANQDGDEEIVFLQIQNGEAQLKRINPLTAEVTYTSESLNQAGMLGSFYGNYLSAIVRGDSTDDWETGFINPYTGEFVALTNNTTNDCCPRAIWATDGVVETDMNFSMPQPSAYYLSDTEDGGRDIYSVNLDGSNRENLTANDEREYTSIESLFFDTLLVGYDEFEGDTRIPRLGFTWNIRRWESGGAYEHIFLTTGFDPDVVDPISLEQLEGFTDAGLVQACTFTFFAEEITTHAGDVYAEPSELSTVVRSLAPRETVQVNGVQPSPSGTWLHLTDGTWVREVDMVPPDNCPALPRILRYEL